MRPTPIRLGAIALAFLFLVAPAQAQKKVPNGAKVLLLAGGARQHHGYRDQALYLAGALEDTGRFEVTIAEDAAILEIPAMLKYDILIVNADRRDPEFKFTESQQQALLNYVKSGHGYISIHGADNAAPDWLPAWRDMLGGVFSHVGLPDSKTKKGKFTVKIVDTQSPITKGLSDFELSDELYYNLQMKPGVEPLATVDHDGGTWPVAWTRTYGPGKDDPLRNPSLLKLAIQGADWVAEGRRTASGTSNTAK